MIASWLDPPSRQLSVGKGGREVKRKRRPQAGAARRRIPAALQPQASGPLSEPGARSPEPVAPSPSHDERGLPPREGNAACRWLKTSRPGHLQPAVPLSSRLHGDKAVGWEKARSPRHRRTISDSCPSFACSFPFASSRQCEKAVAICTWIRTCCRWLAARPDLDRT